MSATQTSAPSSPSRNLVIGTLIISVVALAVGGYALTNQFIASKPAQTERTFFMSIDWLNSTGGTTPRATSRFTPDTLTAFLGDTIHFRIRSNDPRGTAHGFSIDQLGVAETVQAGSWYNATKANLAVGAWRFYCQIHGDAHISGQLLVLNR